MMGLKRPFLGQLDFYIMKKFLGTFFSAIVLIISIAIVFDISENIDKFIDQEVSLKSIIFDFYMNWIPYFANLFSNLFTFIAVIFFTSKMAYNSEVIAMLSGGMSFNRFLRPYLVSAIIIGLFSWFLSNILIPPANKERLAFYNKYVKREFRNTDKDIHRQLEPGLYMYMSSYNVKTDVGYKFSLEKFEGHQLTSKIISDYIKWDREKEVWTIKNYYKRDIVDGVETLSDGKSLDTTLVISPADFKTRSSVVEELDYNQLNKFIIDQRLRGVSNLEVYLLEKYKRTAFPFSAIILTIIGVSIASRKVRGGTGIHIGLGLLLSFTFLLFMQISSVFATEGYMHPLIAIWIPNIVYSVIALVLYKWASR